MTYSIEVVTTELKHVMPLPWLSQGMCIELA
jgi:hypothetical protein